MKYLITGCAGFIGFHLAKKLLNQNEFIIGIDNLNQYYDVKIKKKRLSILKKYKNFKFIYGDLKKKKTFQKIKYEVNITYHLAGQAGVRYSILKPTEYIKDNTIAYLNLLEHFKNSKKIKAIFYASSSSVYGDVSNDYEKELSYKPISVYAVSKLSMELLSVVYFHLYSLKCVGLRFFTVYGPWGRPDMAPIIFAKAIVEKKPINIFNNGDMYRDFTYIDDVIETMFRLIDKPARKNSHYSDESLNPSDSWAPYRIFNVGNSRKISLMNFIEILENELGQKSRKIFIEMQKGDIKSTFADTECIEKWTDFKPNTNLEKGIKEFAKWFKLYYQKNIFDNI